MSAITVKKLTIINVRIQGMIKAMNGLSAEISSMTNLLGAFGIAEDNPISLSAEQVKNDYIAMGIHLHDMIEAKKNIEAEILVDNEN